jgi:hypothetical protein
MNNLTLQLNFHFGSTHAVNHHRLRMIGRLQTLSNPTTPSSWISMSMVCSNCGRICRTVGVIRSKRKKLTILMAQILHLFYIYWKVARTQTITVARKHGRNICPTSFGSFDVYECSFGFHPQQNRIL